MLFPATVLPSCPSYEQEMLETIVHALSVFNSRQERNVVQRSSGVCLTLIMQCRAVLKIKTGLQCPLRAAYFIIVVFHLWPCALYGSFYFPEQAKKSHSVSLVWECRCTESVCERKYLAHARSQCSSASVMSDTCKQYQHSQALKLYKIVLEYTLKNNTNFLRAW